MSGQNEVEQRGVKRMGILGKFKSNILALVDQSAWTLIIIPVIILYWIDAAIVKTILQWVLMIGVVAGITIIIVRVMFPSIRIGGLVEQARRSDKNALPCAIIVLGLLLFVAKAFEIVAMWAKP